MNTTVTCKVKTLEPDTYTFLYAKTNPGIYKPVCDNSDSTARLITLNSTKSFLTRTDCIFNADEVNWDCYKWIKLENAEVTVKFES